MKRAIWAAFVACALAAPAQAGQPQQESDIVVTAERLHEQLRSFVGEVSQPPLREDQLARYNHRVCPGVIGLRGRYAQYMVDRIAQRALEVGLHVGAPGCRANVIVFVTPDSDHLSQELVSDFPELFGSPQSENINTPGRHALVRFTSESRPVRWWHVSNTVSREGHTLRDFPTGRDSRDNFIAPYIRTTSAGFGRLERTTRQDLDRTVIVVDATRAQGLSFDALSDYVAMIGLAQLDPDSDTSQFETILNIFSERDAGRVQTAALTQWDQAYLHGLYDAPRNATGTQQQERAIVRSMEGDIPVPAN